MGSSRSGTPQHEVDLAGDDERAAEELRTDRQLLTGARSRRSSRSGGNEVSNRIVRRTTSMWISSGRARRGRASTRRTAPPSPAIRSTATSTRRVRIERLARADHHLDRAVLQDAGGARPAVFERRRLARDLRLERALAPAEVVELLLAEPQRRRGRSSPRTASSMRSRNRCGRSAGKTGRSPVPISCCRVRRCGSVSCMRACYGERPTCPRRPTTSSERSPTPNGSRSPARLATGRRDRSRRCRRSSTCR